MNTTIIHDYARLDTISSFASPFADATEDRKASTFAPAAGATADGMADATEDRWACLHGFIATWPFFAIFLHFVTKNIFFYLY
ncbi:MAG: hypothetical protein ABSA47_06450 [Verrucomicrobiota bacterium]|jgi:hypothetical protein